MTKEFVKQRWHEWDLNFGGCRQAYKTFFEFLKAGPVSAGPAAGSGTGTPARKTTGEDQYRRQWDSDPALWAEFTDFEAFRAWSKAAEAGLVRRVAGRTK